MKFAAKHFVTLLQRRSSLETAAFLIVGWVGVKLAMRMFAHPEIGVLSEGLTHTPEFKIVFWVVLLLIVAGGWFLSSQKLSTTKTV